MISKCHCKLSTAMVIATNKSGVDIEGLLDGIKLNQNSLVPDRRSRQAALSLFVDQARDARADV